MTGFIFSTIGVFSIVLPAVSCRLPGKILQVPALSVAAANLPPP
jgi:hypothetical protein